MRTIFRTFTRTERDDFTLNVAPRIGQWEEALPLYADGELIGWRIQPRYS